MNIVAPSTLRRRIVVSLYLYVIGIPEPQMRDVERAMILRFLCLYINNVRARDESHLDTDNNNKNV